MAVVGGASELRAVGGGETTAVTSSAGTVVEGPVVCGEEVDGAVVKPASIGTPTEDADASGAATDADESPHPAAAATTSSDHPHRIVAWTSGITLQFPSRTQFP